MNDFLRNWVQSHSLKVTFSENDRILQTEKGILLLVTSKEFYDEALQKNSERVFGTEMSLILNDQDIELLNKYNVDYFLIQFGSRYYYFDDSDITVREIECLKEVETIYYVKQWHDFKYFGSVESQHSDIRFSHLGVHSSFDLCNGSRSYKDWCSKAKWIGVKALGICEDNTLAGTLEFQSACRKAEIKSVIGETITVKPTKGIDYRIKLYCLSDEGWRNLLHVNAIVNSREDKYINESVLFQYQKGLVCVLTPTIDVSKIFSLYQKHFEFLFYQLDYAEWSSEVKDQEWLKNISVYLKNYTSLLLPVLIFDSYYLEQEDYRVQPLLWKIGKRQPGNQSSDRHFKTIDEVLTQATTLFSTQQGYDLVLQAIENTNAIVDAVDFTIPVENKFLPQYELSELEKKQFASNDDLFWSLIAKGLEEKVEKRDLNVEVYIDRIQEEVRVIELGQVRDYFLIVRDILNWAREQSIYLGIGRGSAAGCLVSYLLGIVDVDPIQYGLLFERFLNSGRVGKSLPDIDCDVQSSRRDEIKRYVETRYGRDYAASIGTYGTFKLRAALKDIVREYSGNSKEANYISAIIDSEDSFQSLFHKAVELPINKRFKKFIQTHVKQIDMIPLLFGQPKTSSIHAAGVIIVPKDRGTIQQQLPIKTMDGNLVTEWEGSLIEEAGFLKVDLLGIRQLDKFAEIIKLIKEYRGEEIILNDIPLDDSEVYKFFQEGYNEDVFQFGGLGLKTYCKELLPENIEHLIATVALYRPGPIEIGAHTKYAKIKNGEIESEYDYGIEEITKPTYGVICYQEQIMKIVQELGGFTLVEADDIRKAMGKKLPEVMAKYKEQFIEGAVERRCPRLTAENIWHKMEGFAGYAFNKSHATCYSITGYWSQWLKVNYPLEFWLTSLKYTDQKDIQARISEIKAIGRNIDIAGPNIQKSRQNYFGDLATNTIYWSLNSISFVSDAATEEIIRLRDIEGNSFIDFEDFYNLVQRRKEEKKSQLQAGERMRSPINKRVLTNLILAGAFDAVEGIHQGCMKKRSELLQRLFILCHSELALEPFSLTSERWKKRVAENLIEAMSFVHDYQWIMLQKQICGFGDVDFRSLIKQTEFRSQVHLFKTCMEVAETVVTTTQDRHHDGQMVIVGGIVQKIIERKSKKGPFAQVIIHDGEGELSINIWNETFSAYRELILHSGGQIMFIRGTIVYDSGYKNANVMHSNNNSIINILN